MSRKIIQINRDKCVGCGLCANACQQSAIEMVNGKAQVVRDDYCDGLGNCLPVCPVGAISFSDKNIKNNKPTDVKPNAACSSSAAKSFKPNAFAVQADAHAPIVSQLGQWPVQIKLVAPNAEFFSGANLLVAADCTAFACGDFHNRFMKNKVTIIGCPKLDEGQYNAKLTEIIKNNSIKSLTVARMQVPCCGGLENAAVTALKNSGKFIPWQVVTIATNGTVLDN
ncbi:MAG: 4Fe-4S binding protein [Clostridia bacterium]